MRANTQWKPISLADAGELIMGQSPPGSSYNEDNDGLPLLNGAIELRADGIRVSKYTTEPTRLSRSGDLLFCIRATIGNLNESDRDYCLGRGVAALRVNNNYSKLFVSYQLEMMFDKMRRMSQGGVIKGLKKDDVGNFTFLAPASLRTQNEVASIIKAVDDAIDNTQKVINQTQELKRGLTANIFGDPAKSKRLGDLAKISTGTTPLTSNKEFYSGENPYIKTTDIKGGVISNSSTHVSDEAIKKYRLKKYPAGTVLLAMYGQGKTRGNVSILSVPASITQNAAAIEANDEVLDPEYLWQFLKSQYQSLRGDGVHGHIAHLNLGFVKELQIPLLSLADQLTAAKILAAVDNQIDVNVRLRSKQNTLRLGLMHDLLSGKMSHEIQ